MDNCTCFACKQIETLKSNDIWIRVGASSTYKAITYQKFSIEQDSTLDGLSKLDNFFRHDGTDLGFSFKPRNSVWFSYGSWISDPYHDNDEHYRLDGVRVEAIQNPQHILRIRTLDDLRHFDEKYNTYEREKSFLRKISDSIYEYLYLDDNLERDNDILERNPGGVNWNKVRKDYACIAIEFCKVMELEGATFEDHIYFLWHSAWDVESLVVWDVEAVFGNQVYPLELCS